MDTDTKLRQKIKDDFYVGFYQIEKARNYFQDFVDNGILSMNSFEKDLLDASMHRLAFAFQTMLDVIVDCVDDYMADNTLDAMETHPDGFVSALMNISYRATNEV